MIARLVLIQDGSEEIVVIDTEELSDDALLENYEGDKIMAIIILHPSVAIWPTDRALRPE